MTTKSRYVLQDSSPRSGGNWYLEVCEKRGGIVIPTNRIERAKTFRTEEQARQYCHKNYGMLGIARFVPVMIGGNV